MINSAARMFRPWIGAAASVIVMAGCTTAPGTESPLEDARVRAAIIAIIEADNRCDLDGVIRQYADDAVWFPPNEDPIRGKDAISKRYELLFKNYQPDMKITVDEVAIGRDLAFASGKVAGKITSRDNGKVVPLNDVFVMLLRRSAQGDWRCSRLMWHPAAKRE